MEETFGRVGYLLLYGLAGAGATLGFAVLHPDSVEPLIGASGAIAGVLVAYFVLFPKGLVVGLWFLGIVPMPSVIFRGLWFIGQFGTAIQGAALLLRNRLRTGARSRPATAGANARTSPRRANSARVRRIA